MSDKKGRKFSFPRDRRRKAKSADAVSGKDAAAGEKREPAEAKVAPAPEEPTPPRFEVQAKSGAVHLVVPAKDRQMLSAALTMVMDEVAKAQSGIRRLGLPAHGRLEGIKNIGTKFITYLEKGELTHDGLLPLEMNASEAPVLRIALWLYDRWAEAQDEKVSKKGLSTSMRAATAACEKMADQINDQLSLL